MFHKSCASHLEAMQTEQRKSNQSYGARGQNFVHESLEEDFCCKKILSYLRGMNGSCPLL